MSLLLLKMNHTSDNEQKQSLFIRELGTVIYWFRLLGENGLKTLIDLGGTVWPPTTLSLSMEFVAYEPKT